MTKFSFKTFLQERAFNSREYRKVLKRVQGALVGFEIEAIIPEGHKHLKNVQPTAETVSIDDFDTMDEFEEYFEISSRAARTIENDYQSWIQEKREEYIENNWEDKLDEAEDDEDQARELAGEEFDDDQPEWSEWFSEEHGSAASFVENYDLEPLYGWDDSGSTVFVEAPDEDDGNWGLEAAEDVAHDIYNLLGTQCFAYPDTFIERTKSWAIVPDSSIEGEPNSMGVEIVSPPQSPDKALNDLKALFGYMNKTGIYTNSTTGLHVNLSIPNIQDLDALKLVLFMGDEYVLKQFNRLNNKYTVSQRLAIINSIRDRGVIPNDANNLIEVARDILLRRGKYSSVNLTKISSSYLEFRAAGGENYHKHFDKVEELVGRWISALEIACDENLERQAYMKKVAKLLQAIPDESETINTAEMSLIDVLAKYDALARHLLRSPKSKEEFINIFAKIASHVGGDIKPSLRQAKEIRALLRNNDVSVKEINAYVNGNSDDGRAGLDSRSYEKFMLAFKLK